MTYIQRYQEPRIRNKLFKGRAIIVYGARRVGKTSMIKHITENQDKRILWINADEPGTNVLLEKSSAQLKTYFGDAEIIVIDEAQTLKNPGKIIKRIVDYAPHYQVFATGSSSFELASKVSEPLTGRKWEFSLFPFSVGELSEHSGFFEVDKKLDSILIYGLYPEVYLNDNKREILAELTGSYLFRDILSFDRIRKSEKIKVLTSALAMQTAQEISYPELGEICGLDSKTVEKYIDILEKAFVVFRLRSFSRNLRNELKHKQKIYFWDNGIRNALINDFRPPELRNDSGHLWENFVVSERMKIIRTFNPESSLYFWRTAQQQEIDLIEIRNGEMFGYEIKYNPKRKVHFSRTFRKAYPEARLFTINKNNYADFLIPPKNPQKL